jgi:hypothetical protein
MAAGLRILLARRLAGLAFCRAYWAFLMVVGHVIEREEVLAALELR